LRLRKLAKFKRQYSHRHLYAPSVTFTLTQKGGSV
jgi:hypothetical protein